MNWTLHWKIATLLAYLALLIATLLCADGVLQSGSLMLRPL